MIAPATKYASVSGDRHGRPQRTAESSTAVPSIFIPRLGKELRFDEWYWKELREGGMLDAYIRRERAQTTKRYRAVARKVHDHKQNNKSDVRRLADIPLRDYLRWRATDRNFWEDNSNLRSLRRDNPDAQVYL